MSILDSCVQDQVVVERFKSMLVAIAGSDCLWWKGAISRNAGHGRFWLGRGSVIIAHRFAYALVEGAEALGNVEVLAHGCDNPLCQRIGDGHVAPSTAAQNRADWLARGGIATGNLVGPSPSFERALLMRNLLRLDADDAAAHLASLPALYGHQPALW